MHGMQIILILFFTLTTMEGPLFCISWWPQWKVHYFAFLENILCHTSINRKRHEHRIL